MLMSNSFDFGVAVDVEAEQELGARVALLGEELQLLLGRHGIACLQGLDRFLHAGGGRLGGEQQGGPGEGQGGADETNEMHGRSLREARAGIGGTADRLAWN